MESVVSRRYAVTQQPVLLSDEESEEKSKVRAKALQLSVLRKEINRSMSSIKKIEKVIENPISNQFSPQQ